MRSRLPASVASGIRGLTKDRDQPPICVKTPKVGSLDAVIQASPAVLTNFFERKRHASHAKSRLFRRDHFSGRRTFLATDRGGLRSRARGCAPEREIDDARPGLVQAGRCDGLADLTASEPRLARGRDLRQRRLDAIQSRVGVAKTGFARKRRHPRNIFFPSAAVVQEPIFRRGEAPDNSRQGAWSP